MDDLQKAIDDLEIDTGKLDEVLNGDEITNIDRDKYTDESLKSLDEAIENAKDVLDNPNSSLEDIKNAADGVLEAIGNLEEKEESPVDSDVPTAIKYLYVKSPRNRRFLYSAQIVIFALIILIHKAFFIVRVNNSYRL